MIFLENNNKTENAFSQKLKDVSEKVISGFIRFGDVIRNHKIITSVVVVLVVLIAAVFGVANHFLNKINIVDNHEQTATETVITLSTGERLDVTGLMKGPDGRYILPDGRKFNSDGTVWNLDGSIVFYDGSYIRADGVVVLSDGATIYTDTNVVFQDGSYLSSTGIKVDKSGYATFKSGQKAHITTFTIASDGTVTPKESKIATLKYRLTEAMNIKSKTPVKTQKNNDEEDDEAIIEQSRDKLAQSDKSIAQNFNDKKIWYNDNIMNILLMGIDRGSKSYPQGRSDSMIVLSINKTTKKVKMISLSRAAYVAIRGYDNTRLNHAHGLGGAPLAIDTIERNYKFRIDNYVSTNFDTFKQLIDTIGGVNIKLNKKEASALKNKIKANGLAYNGEGSYKLNGNLALEYVRLRKIDTDRARTQRQRNVLMAIVNKAKSMNVFQISATLNRILPLITTDLSKSEIVSQAMNVQSYLNGDIEQYVVPHKPTNLTLRDDFEVLILDWTAEVKYIHDIMYGDVTPSYLEK